MINNPLGISINPGSDIDLATIISDHLRKSFMSEMDWPFKLKVFGTEYMLVSRGFWANSHHWGKVVRHVNGISGVRLQDDQQNAGLARLINTVPGTISGAQEDTSWLIYSWTWNEEEDTFVDESIARIRKDNPQFTSRIPFTHLKQLLNSSYQPDLPHEYSVIPEEPKEADEILSGPLPSDQVCAKDESPHAPEAEQPLKIRICRPLNNNMKPGPLVPSAPTTHSHPPDVEVAPEEADTSKSDLPEPEGATVELHKSQGAPWSQVAQKFAKDPRSAFAKKNMPTSKHSSRQCTGRVLYKGQTTCVKEGAGTNKGSNVGTKKGRNVGTNEGTSAKEASDVGTNKATSANEASEVGIKEGNHFGAQGAVSTTTISFQPAPLTDADWERMAARGAAYWEAHWDNKHTKDLILPKPSQDVVANTQSLPNEHVANAAGYRCSARRTGTSVP
ncbi:hypothetical protein PSTT_05674 [Puccinia striiformis]|uniref:Uncharacterized protein n=1 Tax=Puccinia striiformis TaxID=27350 RepID=A0A2S4VN62_9BASI|nr:hypothetical protein PSTT_05674 [Puccinia striiformis]